MHIYLVRHTEFSNPDNIYPFHLPLHLSEKGRIHAAKIGKWLADRSLSKLSIYSSPIVRCVQTAEIISASTNSSVSVDGRLIEIYCPNLQGVKEPETEKWKQEDDESRESWEETKKRIKNIYEEKIKEDNDCILVSHGEPITLLYYDLLGKKPPDYLWNPENRDLVVIKGIIVDIEVQNGKTKNITKHTAVTHPKNS